MKQHIIKSVIAVATSLALIPSICAQNIDAPYVENTDKAIAFKKSVTQTPNEKGEFIIKLEAFATGTMTYTNDANPADVVLILDVSGSMDETYTVYNYTANPQPAKGYVYSTSYSNLYAKFNDEYYPVQKGRTYHPAEGHWETWLFIPYWVEDVPEYYSYYLYVSVNSVRYYLSDTSFVIDEPENVTDQNGAIWNGTLYKRQSTTFNKLEKLKSSVLDFIRIIDENDIWADYPTNSIKRTKNGIESRLGNTIAIVPFASSITTTGNYARLLPLTRRSDLEALVNDLEAEGGTYAHLGMQKALDLLDDLSDDRKNRTTVLFTDGNPGLYGDWRYDDTWDSANKTINYSDQVKGLANTTKGINSTVFTIGLFNEPTANTNTYMSKASSDYKDATSMDTGTRLTNGKYYKKAGEGEDDLAEIFKGIAEVSGGTSSEIGSGSSATIDIVSTSFNIPTGADHSSIEIWTAPVIGQEVWPGDGKTYLTFGTEVMKGTPDANVLDDVTLVPNPSNLNEVKVTGFDFAENYCAYESNTHTPHGYKLILKIPIMINEDAVGGPAVETNTGESGIYLENDDDPLITFNKPTVKIPVNLWILKSGLKEKESARFTIQRKDMRTAGNEYVDYQTVVLVGGQNEVTRTFTDKNGIQQTFTGPMVKILGLDPNYHYRIKEENWSWTYSNQEMTPMTTEGLTVNPFVIKNTKTTPDIKNAESSVHNQFTTRKTAK